MNEREEQLATQDVEARDEARMNDYVLPPDPDGHNRLLDRGAAEHLASVAPWLAPCLSCQAGLCGEHGAPRVAATTGTTCQMCHGTGVVWMGGATGRSAWTAPVPCAACRPPAPAAEARGPQGPCDCGQDACRERRAHIFPAAEASNRGWLRSTLEARGVVLTPDKGQDAIDLVTGKRLGPEPDDPPAPAAEAKGEMSREAFAARLDYLWAHGNCGDGGAELKGTVMAYVDRLRTRASEAEERAEKTTEHLLNSVARAVQRGDELERERDAERYMRGVNQRASENAEKAVAVVRRERDEATTRAKVAERTAEEWEAARDSDVDAVWAEVADAAMKAWDKPMPYNDSPAELIAKIIDERDEAREQRDAAKLETLNEKARADTNDELCDSFMKSSRKHAEERDVALGTVTSLRFDLAAAVARAEEAENDFKNCASVGRRLEAEMNGWRTRSAETAQAREEAEKRATLAEAHDRQPYPTAAAYEAACRTLEAERYARRKAEQDAANVRARNAETSKLAEAYRARLAAAEAEVKRLREYEVEFARLKRQRDTAEIDAAAGREKLTAAEDTRYYLKLPAPAPESKEE